MLTVLDLMIDTALLANSFPGASWDAWRAALAALFGLPMSEAQLEIYRRCTGRTTPPTTQAREGWFVCGRRGGKSLVMALVAVYLATVPTYRLAPGERGVVMLIASDRRQAKVLRRYVGALLQACALLRVLIAEEKVDEIVLSNGISVEVHTASSTSVRGYTVVAAVCDEIAFWQTSEGAADPDVEILAALRPATATIPNALLLVISSPYARRGALWNAYERHYGKDGDPVLVWQADTKTMNPTVPDAVIATAYAEDEASASAEYGAQFRKDVERLLTLEAVEGAVVPGRRGIAPSPGTTYLAFCDPSGGSNDAMTLAIAHRDSKGRAVLDALEIVKAPFSPDAATRHFAGVLKQYGLSSVQGDRYGGEWPAERFRTYGITYRMADAPKSELYRGFVALLNGQRVELLDEPQLSKELLALERSTGRGGRERIDHPPNGRDDAANSASGACLAALQTQSVSLGTSRWGYE